MQVWETKNLFFGPFVSVENKRLTNESCASVRFKGLIGDSVDIVKPATHSPDATSGRPEAIVPEATK
jgi:hypothetical protein